MSSAGMNKTKILLIDDEEAILLCLKELLESEGFEIVTAGDGEKGLQKIETVEPDLVILDMNMPNLGGFTFYQRIPRNPDGSTRFPVLALTAAMHMEGMMRALGVAGFMTKPFDSEVLLARIREILGKRPDKSGSRRL